MPLRQRNEIYPITHNPNLTMREKKKNRKIQSVAFYKMPDHYFSKLSRSSETGQI